MADDKPFLIKFRRNTATRWTVLNPILAEGEPGYEKYTGKMKIGDGRTYWNDLAYFTPVTSGTPTGSLSEHVFAAEPHPVYDDGPSLVLLYQNAKV